MQLTRHTTLLGAAALLLAAGAGVARADGTVSVRGAYYKERATRVEQPMIDADLEAGPNARVTTHFLVDAITSASAAAGATGQPFTELRYEAGASYLRQLGKLRLGGGARYSYESDYRSLFAHLRGEIDLAQRNTTLGLTLSQGHDNVSNEGGQIEPMTPIRGTLDTSMASLSFTQILSRDLVAALTYDVMYLSGFQENPYRLVAAGGAFEPERVPDTRLRHAVRASIRGFFAPTNSVLIFGYRFYTDDWGIIGHTPEVRLAQPLGEDIDIHLGYRLYQQSAADFYEKIYDTSDPVMEPFLTADEKLSSLRTQAVSAKLDVRLGRLGFTGQASQMWGHLLVEYVSQTTSYGDALSAQIALSIPVSY